ncbi:hypothetical protein HDU93_002863 [Gonapodya sp. JEL0774]|nr:hypothetical protein HDU93_002863 [Gonapodya sp. JEL0774]
MAPIAVGFWRSGSQLRPGPDVLLFLLISLSTLASLAPLSVVAQGGVWHPRHAALVYIAGPGPASASILSSTASLIKPYQVSFFPHTDFIDASASNLTFLSQASALIGQRWSLTLDSQIASYSDDKVIEELVEECRIVQKLTGRVPRFLYYLPNMVTLRLHTLARSLGYILPGVLWDFPDQDNASNITANTTQCSNWFSGFLASIPSYSPDSLGGVWANRDTYACTATLAPIVVQALISKGFIPVDIATCLGETNWYRESCDGTAVALGNGSALAGNASTTSTPASSTLSVQSIVGSLPTMSSVTTPDPSPGASTSSQSVTSGPSTSVIAGSVTGTVAALILLSALAVFYRRRTNEGHIFASAKSHSRKSSTSSIFSPGMHSSSSMAAIGTEGVLASRPPMPARQATDRTIYRPRTPVDSLDSVEISGTSFRADGTASDLRISDYGEYADPSHPPSTSDGSESGGEATRLMVGTDASTSASPVRARYSPISPQTQAPPPGWISAGTGGGASLPNTASIYSSPTSTSPNASLPLTSQLAAPVVASGLLSSFQTSTTSQPALSNISHALALAPPPSVTSLLSAPPPSLLPPDPSFLLLGGSPTETAVRVGRAFLAEVEWVPQRGDELTVQRGEPLWVWVIYRDGWCLATNLSTASVGNVPFIVLDPSPTSASTNDTPGVRGPNTPFTAPDASRTVATTTPGTPSTFRSSFLNGSVDLNGVGGLIGQYGVGVRSTSLAMGAARSVGQLWGGQVAESGVVDGNAASGNAGRKVGAMVLTDMLRRGEISTEAFMKLAAADSQELAGATSTDGHGSEELGNDNVSQSPSGRIYATPGGVVSVKSTSTLGTVEFGDSIRRI